MDILTRGSNVATDLPQTRTGLAADLRRLGIADGDTLLVHASLRRVGWVVGGPVAVVQALRDAVGSAGTIVVPTGTADNSDPSRWHLTGKQAVPAQWWPAIREHMLPFDSSVTPSTNMGAVAETVRVWPGAVRSQNPKTSFAALGPHAEWLMADHALECLLGEQSPLATLEKVGAKILLLGVGYEVCTAFHLAEYRATAPPVRDYECVVGGAGGRRWHRYEDVALSDVDFADLGAALEESDVGARYVRHGYVGAAPCRVLSLPGAVEFAVGWLARSRSHCESTSAT
jgi:aminoglycoside 3-N-acetyltransferase